MTESKDFNVYNMPGMLSRRVTRRDPVDPNKWIPDDSWHKSVRDKMTVLFSFYVKHSLIKDPQLVREPDRAVLRFSDFTTAGQKFIKSGASDRWLAAFDRPGAKKDLNDVLYLEKQLKAIEPD